MILKNLARQNIEQPRCTRNDDSAITTGSIRGSVRTLWMTPTWRCTAPRSRTTGGNERDGADQVFGLYVTERELSHGIEGGVG